MKVGFGAIFAKTEKLSIRTTCVVGDSASVSRGLYAKAISPTTATLVGFPESKLTFTDSTTDEERPGSWSSGCLTTTPPVRDVTDREDRIDCVSDASDGRAGAARGTLSGVIGGDELPSTEGLRAEGLLIISRGSDGPVPAG